MQVLLGVIPGTKTTVLNKAALLIAISEVESSWLVGFSS